MRITIISGFLGSGKTTLLRRVVRETRANRMAVIVNDMSELEVDGDLVRDPELLNEAKGNFASICSGSIHADQRTSFGAVLDEWNGRTDIDHVVIETSGSTHPRPLLEEIQARPSYRVGAFVVMVDAKSMADDFMLGRDIVQASESPGAETPAHLMLDQLRIGTHILVSKADRVTQVQLHRIAEHLTRIQPAAEMLAVNYGRIAPEKLMTGGDFDLQAALASLSDSADQDIGSVVISDARPLHPERLWHLFRHQIGAGIHRSKGYLWMPSRDRDVLLWNQAGGLIEMELTAYWKAALITNPDGKLIPEEIDRLHEMLQGTHPIFGDRACELTVIGTQRDRATFVPELMKCFCTETEVSAWQRGERFTDPWPKTLRQV